MGKHQYIYALILLIMTMGAAVSTATGQTVPSWWVVGDNPTPESGFILQPRCFAFSREEAMDVAAALRVQGDKSVHAIPAKAADAQFNSGILDNTFFTPPCGGPGGGQ